MTGELVALKELVARKWKNTSLGVKGSMGEKVGEQVVDGPPKVFGPLRHRV